MPTWMVVCVTAMPRTYRSPGRTSGIIAERADLNGESSSVTTNSSATMIHSAAAEADFRLTRAIRQSSTIRATSQATITSRRGRRSASPDRARPPISHGRNVTA